MRHGTYNALKIVPCECGSTEPYWHGPEHGIRVYCCDACWHRTDKTKSNPNGTCPNCGSGQDKHEDNGLSSRSVEYTILCTACTHQWSPNES